MRGIQQVDLTSYRRSRRRVLEGGLLVVFELVAASMLLLTNSPKLPGEFLLSTIGIPVVFVAAFVGCVMLLRRINPPTKTLTYLRRGVLYGSGTLAMLVLVFGLLLLVFSFLAERLM